MVHPLFFTLPMKVAMNYLFSLKAQQFYYLDFNLNVLGLLICLAVDYQFVLLHSPWCWILYHQVRICAGLAEPCRGAAPVRIVSCKADRSRVHEYRLFSSILCLSVLCMTISILPNINTYLMIYHDS